MHHFYRECSLLYPSSDFNLNLQIPECSSPLELGPLSIILHGYKILNKGKKLSCKRHSWQIYLKQQKKTTISFNCFLQQPRMPFSNYSTFSFQEVYLNQDIFCPGVKKIKPISHPILPQNQQLLKMHSLRC